MDVIAVVIRWLPIIWSAVILVIGTTVQNSAPKIGLFQPETRSNAVTYDITAQLVFTPPVGTKVAHVWLVKPPNDAGQEVLAFEAEPKPKINV